MWAYVYQLRGRTRAERPPASSTPGSPLTQIVGGDVKDLADGARRQAALGQEHGGRAACDQVREVLLGVGGDQDRPRRLQARLAVEPSHELEAALVGEVDVHQRDVRLEVLGSSQRLRAGGGNPDHGDPLSFQETACGLHEAGLSSTMRQRRAMRQGSRGVCPDTFRPAGICLAVGSSLLLLLVGAAFAVLLVSVADLRTSTRLARHSEEVLAAANQLERLIVDLETGERGFVITGQDQFLQPWQAARIAIPGQARTLERLTVVRAQHSRAQRITEAA